MATLKSRFSLLVLCSIFSIYCCHNATTLYAQENSVTLTDLALDNTEVDDPPVCSPDDIKAVCRAIYNNIDDVCGIALDVMQCLGILDCARICSGHPQPIRCQVGCEIFARNPTGKVGKRFREEACNTVQKEIKKPLILFCNGLINSLE